MILSAAVFGTFAAICDYFPVGDENRDSEHRCCCDDEGDDYDYADGGADDDFGLDVNAADLAHILKQFQEFEREKKIK